MKQPRTLNCVFTVLVARPNSLGFGSEARKLCDEIRTAELPAGVAGHSAWDLQRRFDTLKTNWYREVNVLSSSRAIVDAPSYARIIGMGEAAIPMIVKELLESPDHWDYALVAITGEDPVPEDVAGDMKAIAATWQRWARERGYC